MLYEHKVLTTQQIVELCYPSMRAANHRLLDLFMWRVVDRFQPFVTTGTAPMHYVLDIAGAVALAYEDGLDPKSTRLPARRRDRHRALPAPGPHRRRQRLLHRPGRARADVPVLEGR